MEKHISYFRNINYFCKYNVLLICYMNDLLSCKAKRYIIDKLRVNADLFYSMDLNYDISTMILNFI